MSRKIPVHWQGRKQLISVRKAIHLRLVNDALGGNLKTIEFLLRHFVHQMSPEQEKVYRTVDEIKTELKRRNIWGVLRTVMDQEAEEAAEAGLTKR